MSDVDFLIIAGLVLLSVAAIGFVLGYCANPEDSHD